MSFIVDGKEFKYFPDDQISVDGRRVIRIDVDGKMVYPDPKDFALIDGIPVLLPTNKIKLEKNFSDENHPGSYIEIEEGSDIYVSEHLWHYEGSGGTSDEREQIAASKNPFSFRILGPNVNGAHEGSAYTYRGKTVYWDRVQGLLSQVPRSGSRVYARLSIYRSWIVVGQAIAWYMIYGQ